MDSGASGHLHAPSSCPDGVKIDTEKFLSYGGAAEDSGFRTHGKVLESTPVGLDLETIEHGVHQWQLGGHVAPVEQTLVSTRRSCTRAT